MIFCVSKLCKYLQEWLQCAVFFWCKFLWDICIHYNYFPHLCLQACLHQASLCPCLESLEWQQCQGFNDQLFFLKLIYIWFKFYYQSYHFLFCTFIFVDLFPLLIIYFFTMSHVFITERQRDITTICFMFPHKLNNRWVDFEKTDTSIIMMLICFYVMTFGLNNSQQSLYFMELLTVNILW